MRASELRIGNWVYSELRNMQIELFDFADILNYYNANNLDHIEPIPLTEEWLVKFGFEDNGQSYEIEYCVVRRNYNNKVMFDLFKNGEFIHSELKHVHQLQNLYFALTGEELTIKE